MSDHDGLDEVITMPGMRRSASAALFRPDERPKSVTAAGDGKMQDPQE
jgi:hypothetical protein